MYHRVEQPVPFTLNGHNVYLAHGDRYETGLGYEIYTKLLRNRLTLILLKPFQQPMIDTQIKQLKQKHICRPLKNFEAKAHAIAQHYPKESLIIEGHFHQGIRFNNYISLPSLVCQKQIGIVKEGSILFQAL